MGNLGLEAGGWRLGQERIAHVVRGDLCATTRSGRPKPVRSIERAFSSSGPQPPVPSLSAGAGCYGSAGVPASLGPPAPSRGYVLEQRDRLGHPCSSVAGREDTLSVFAEPIRQASRFAGKDERARALAGFPISVAFSSLAWLSPCSSPCLRASRLALPSTASQPALSPQAWSLSW